MSKLSPKVSELPLQPPLREASVVVVVVVVVREYDEKTDKEAVEKIETLCESGSLVTDTMGDPLCRIRNSSPCIMLVAEYGEDKEIVGMIRGCLKTVTSGKKYALSEFPVYEKVAYVLGLRVSPSHRRLGLGTMLVEKLEQWCKERGAQYAYMATDCHNNASIDLFTLKCAYVKFRTPTILVQPVHQHKKPLGSRVAVVRLTPRLAELVYNRVFADSEFFPKDINVVLSNKLNLGTFMAMPKKYLPEWNPGKADFPPKFAILSVWNNKQVFRMQVKGASRLIYACCAGTRVVDKLVPWLRIPSVPNVFKPFGVYLLYGLYMEGGKGASRLMKSLCSFVHNMARKDAGCGAVVAEVGKWDPVVEGVPHWRRFSWAEDVWCMKRLTTAKQSEKEEVSGTGDWTRSQALTPVIFVDPREF